jgi:hypothetical protein
MTISEKTEGKNELVRHLLSTLVYRTTKISLDAPQNYLKISIENKVRTQEKILGRAREYPISLYTDQNVPKPATQIK